MDAVNTAIFLKELSLEFHCWKSVDIHVLSDNNSLVQLESFINDDTSQYKEMVFISCRIHIYL